MRINEEINNKIENVKMAKSKAMGHKYGMGLRLDPTTGDVYINDTRICDLDDLGQFVDEVICLHHAIAEVTGIFF